MPKKTYNKKSSTTLVSKGLSRKVKVSFATLVCIVVLLFASLGYVVANPAVQTIIEEGSGVETATWVVFKDGSTYNAKNGTTGEIDYSSSNATALMENLIEGGNVAIAITSELTLTSGSIIIDEHNVTLVGYGGSIVNSQTDGSNAITIYSPTTVTSWRIWNLRIIGNSQSGDGISANFTGYSASSIKDCIIESHGLNGIHLQRAYCVSVENTELYYNGQHGILLENWCNLNKFINCRSKHNTLDGLCVQRGMDTTTNNLVQNMFISCEFASNDRYGVQTSRGSNQYGAYATTFDTCYIEANENHGMLLNGRVEYVENSFFSGNGAGGSGYNVYVNGTASMFILNSWYMTGNDGHMCIGNGASHIWVEERQDCITTDNTVIGYNVYKIKDLNTYRIEPWNGTSFSGNWVQLPNVYHPSCTGWGSADAGMMWWCLNDTVIEYWDGSAIKTVTGT